MHEWLVELVALIVPWTEAVGIAIVMWGAIEGLIKLLLRFSSLFNKAIQPLPISQIRLAIGEKIALGLDFFTRRRHHSNHHYPQLAIARHFGWHRHYPHHHRFFLKSRHQRIRSRKRTPLNAVSNFQFKKIMAL